MRKVVVRDRSRYQDASMVNVLVRDLSPEVHAGLVKRAAANGMSLQQFLLTELSRVAERPTMAEVIARIERRLDRSPARTSAEDDWDGAMYVNAARDERMAQILSALDEGSAMGSEDS